MKQYELVIVLDGKASSAKKKAATEKIEKMVKVTSGSVKEVTDWGVKDLAYPIRDLTTGAYLIFDVELTGVGAKSLNDKLHLEEEIIRYLLVTKPKALVRIKSKPRTTFEVAEA